MINGVLLLKMNGDPYYSPPFARRALRAILAVQTSNLAGAPTLDVTIEHRNRDEIGWTVAGVIPPVTTATTQMVELAGLKEVLRYKFVISATTATAGMHVFVPTPSWFNE